MATKAIPATIPAISPVSSVLSTSPTPPTPKAGTDPSPVVARLLVVVTPTSGISKGIGDSVDNGGIVAAVDKPARRDVEGEVLEFVVRVVSSMPMVCLRVCWAFVAVVSKESEMPSEAGDELDWSPIAEEEVEIKDLVLSVPSAIELVVPTLVSSMVVTSLLTTPAVSSAVGSLK